MAPSPMRVGLQIPNFNFPGVTPEDLLDTLTGVATTAESSGSKQSLFNACFTLFGPGQRVLIPGQGRKREGGSHDNSFKNENGTPGVPLTHVATKSSVAGSAADSFSYDNS